MDDRSLRKELRRRDAEQAKKDGAAAAALEPGGACPVCGKKVAAGSPPPLKQFVVSRPPLKCEACKLELPWRPSHVARALGTVAGLGLMLYGLRTILDAQQVTDSGTRASAFLLGGVFLCLGAAGYGQLESMVAPRQLALRVAAKRREVEDGKPPKGPFGGEYLRELVFAAVLYLILRHFAVEAFVIPTGSMAPTLYGNNFRTVCERCDFPFAVGLREGEKPTGLTTYPVKCPSCAVQGAARPTRVTDGNKILVNKLLYKLRRPRRWEVVVFRWPEGPDQAFIKRLVGLPGETLRVIDGDLYADGELQRKPDDLMDVLWLPWLDAAYAYDGATADQWRAAPGWDLSDKTGRRLVATGPGPAWLEHARLIKDETSYNADRGDGLDPVSDVRVAATVSPAAGATAVKLVIREAWHDATREVVATFPVGAGQGTFTLEAGGKLLGQATRAALPAGRTTRVTLAYHDDRARLLVGDDEVVAANDDAATPRVDDEDAPARLGDRTVRVLLGAVGPVAFLDPRIDRDIHYTVAGGRNDPGKGPVKVPDDGFFCMGDNSASSSDSRAWGFVREGHLLGRAFYVWWPVLPFEWRRVR